MASMLMPSQLIEELQEFRCHFDWNLEDGLDSSTDIETITTGLDNHLEDHADQLPVFSKTLKGYLYMSSLNPRGERDPHEALRWFDKAVEDNEKEMQEDTEDKGPMGDRIIILANKARVLLCLGEDKKAGEILNTLAGIKEHLKSEKVQAYIDANKAFCSFWLGQSKFDLGLTCYDRALKVYPTKESWLIGKALLVGKFKHCMRSTVSEQGVSELEIIYRKVLRINPDNMFARVRLAVTLASRKCDYEAMHHFDEAWLHGKDKLHVVTHVAEFYLRKRDFRKARGLLDEALCLHPKSPFIHRLFGDLYRAMAKTGKYEVGKNNQTAIEWYDKAMKLSFSTKPAVLRNKAWVLFDQGKIQQAKAVFEQQTNSQSTSIFGKADRHLTFAQFLDKLDVEEEKRNAMRQYKMALIAHPTRRSGSCLQTIKILKEKCVELLSVNPKNVDALELTGWLYSKINHTESACFYYERAYEIKPSDFLASTLVDLYRGANNHLKADDFSSKIIYSNAEEKTIKDVSFHISNGQQSYEMLEFDVSRREYSRAADLHSLQGSEGLLNVLKQVPEDGKYEIAWFNDLAKILVNVTNTSKLIEWKEEGDNEKVSKRAKKLHADLFEILKPQLRVLKELYKENVEFFSLTFDSDHQDQINVSNATMLLRKARDLLNSCVRGFENSNYNLRDTGNRFFYVKDGHSIPRELAERILSYGWVDFALRFGKLFLFLVDIQPGSNLRENGWLEKLFSVCEDNDQPVELMLQGLSVNDGNPACDADLVEFAKEAVVKTAIIVREFYKYIKPVEAADRVESVG
ncbi:antiviral innate immune response effector IFIT1-like [Glandiceps talaboti]